MVKKKVKKETKNLKKTEKSKKSLVSESHEWKILQEEDRLSKEQFERDVKLQEIAHKLEMERLNMRKQIERLKHEWELERGRIKSAEVRKHLQEKMALRSYGKSYQK